jgi:ABC-type multidrug transport system ATPase subunit
MQDAMEIATKPTNKSWTLRLEGLTKIYSDNVLFRNLDLEIRPGMAIHVQGPNGAGKTQLMLVIAGLVNENAGRILFHDQRDLLLNRMEPEIRARFARYVPYLPGDIAEMPIDRALLVMTRRLHPFSLAGQRPAAAKLVSELNSELHSVGGLNLELDRPLTNYSIGQQKRFMAKASLGVEPYPFLAMLDEPLAALDSDGIARVIHLMREARERGIALLVAEHRKEIFDFDFDSVLHLPYNPDADGTHPPLMPVQEGAKLDRQKGTKTVLRATNVVAGYTSSPVYCPSFSVSRGELVIIHGPNGSGKTGFVRGLLGHPGTTLSGRLEFEGLAVPNLQIAQKLSALRYLSQKRDLFPDLTVHESIMVSGRSHETEMDSEIADIVRFLGPGKLVRHLSSGGRALLGLAQTLAGGPKFLILDEPAANTDIDNRRRVWDLIDKTCRQGQTAVLVIEHDLTPASGSATYQIQQRNGSSILIKDPE